ncbi:MAG: hypothetical protein R2873_00780 [Caldilineaceae bacterium]|nr:response regulator transcription factor [Caldilineaceae bacterium]
MSKKILLFDDDYETMEPFKLLLEEAGYAVELTAEQTILQRMTTEEFSLICVDLMIHPRSPNQGRELVNNVGFQGVNWQYTGKELVKRIRSGEYEAEQNQGTKSSVPIIILSATGNMFDTGDEGFDTQVNEIYEKPFDAVKLLHRIGALLGE